MLTLMQFHASDELPFELDGINLKKHYWDKEKKMPKNKIEDKE